MLADHIPFGDRIRNRKLRGGFRVSAVNCANEFQKPCEATLISYPTHWLRTSRNQVP